MEITAKSLRSRVGEVLDCVARGESVVITYRGKPRAKLIGISQPRQAGKESRALSGFGMWKDHEKTQDVGAYVRELRKLRHAG